MADDPISISIFDGNYLLNTMQDHCNRMKIMIAHSFIIIFSSWCQRNMER